jgi:hypothetical protein
MELQPSRDFDFVKKPKTRRKIKVSKKKNGFYSGLRDE